MAIKLYKDNISLTEGIAAKESLESGKALFVLRICSN